MAKIIYIAGLGHSGSTILDMSLGTLDGVIGLGEFKTLLDEKTRSRHLESGCSCGKKARQCPVWSQLPSLFQDTESDIERVNASLSFLNKKEGKETILVDSSKNSYPYLKELNKEHDLRVIFLTRDIRSWSYSRFLSTGKPLLYFAFRWFAENLKLLKQIGQMGIPLVHIGYEEMALFPEYSLKSLCSDLDLEYNSSMLIPEKTGSHIISGNVARVDSEKRSGWFYDARWMASSRNFLLGPLLLLFSRRNNRLVYSRVKKGDIRNFHLFGTNRKERLSKENN